MDLFVLIVVLVFAMLSGWLIARQVFLAMEKRESKWANTASVFTAMISLVAIVVLLVVAVSFSGAFHR